MSRRTTSLWLVLASTACTATLADATYGCPDHHCPSSMTCWSDGLCHFGTESQTDSGMPQPDSMMPPMPDMGGPSRCTTACSGGEDCVIGAWTSPMPSYRCASFSQIMTASHGMQCTMGPSCTSPDVCIPGSGTMRCMRPCGMLVGDNCGFGETCVMHMGGGMGGVCARACAPTGMQCPMMGAVCFGGYCMPPSF
jgi:hypothetical protein